MLLNWCKSNRMIDPLIALPITLTLMAGCATAPVPEPLAAYEKIGVSEEFIDYLLDGADNELELMLGTSPRLVGTLENQSPIHPQTVLEAASEQGLIADSQLQYLNTPPIEDMWDRIRLGMALPYHEHKRIDRNLSWYGRHPAYFARVAERAEKYLHLVMEEVEKRGFPTEIALLPIVESAYQPFAYSHGRAAGIWQFIPSTGRLYGLKQNWWYDGRRDIVASTRAAMDLLDDLQRRFKGDWMLALAAYNSGQGTVSRAIRKNLRKGKPTDFWSLDLPPETEDYVPKLMAIAEIIAKPGEFGIELEPIPNEPYMARVEVGSQIDMALAAELADIELDELYMLNPGFNRWATDPKGPHFLMVPQTNADVFAENLAQMPTEERIRWARHKVRKGESLLAIADKYNTTVKLIKDVNKIRGNTIRVGDGLVIPVATKDLAAYNMSAEQRLRSLQNTKRKGRNKIVYQVRPGDTLWDIARKYGVGVRTLAKWNGMAPRDSLRSGQKLVIWSKWAKRRIKQAQFSPHSANVVTQKIRYRVRRGDSLALISQKFRVSLNDLKRWNGLSGEKYLQPGQRLTLYVDVTAQAGT